MSLPDKTVLFHTGFFKASRQKACEACPEIPGSENTGLVLHGFPSRHPVRKLLERILSP